MAIQITSPAGPSEVSVSSKTTLTTTHLDLAVAGTEYTLVIPVGAKSISIKAVNSACVDIASASGGTSTDDKYTLFPGCGLEEELLAGTNALNIYVSSDTNNTVLQIKYWI